MFQCNFVIKASLLETEPPMAEAEAAVRVADGADDVDDL
jgi:hypothetical protein